MKTFTSKLFNESGCYTDESTQLDNEFVKALRPIFEEWLKEGFSPREIAHVAIHSVFELELDEMMTVMYEIPKEQTDVPT